MSAQCMFCGHQTAPAALIRAQDLNTATGYVDLCGPCARDAKVDTEYIVDFGGGVIGFDVSSVDKIPDFNKMSRSIGIMKLAIALHAEAHRGQLGTLVRDRPRDETYADAERRIHAIMWAREPSDVRERYAVRAVGLMLWMGGVAQ